MSSKTSQKKNKGIRGMGWIFLFVAACLGITAFILHFTNKMKCPEGYTFASGIGLPPGLCNDPYDPSVPDPLTCTNRPCPPFNKPANCETTGPDNDSNQCERRYAGEDCKGVGCSCDSSSNCTDNLTCRSDPFSFNNKSHCTVKDGQGDLGDYCNADEVCKSLKCTGYRCVPQPGSGQQCDYCQNNSQCVAGSCHENRCNPNLPGRKLEGQSIPWGKGADACASGYAIDANYGWQCCGPQNPANLIMGCQR